MAWARLAPVAVMLGAAFADGGGAMAEWTLGFVRGARSEAGDPEIRNPRSQVRGYV
jgi:hypothetical protein